MHPLRAHVPDFLLVVHLLRSQIASRVRQALLLRLTGCFCYMVGCALCGHARRGHAETARIVSHRVAIMALGRLPLGTQVRAANAACYGKIPCRSRNRAWSFALSSASRPASAAVTTSISSLA